MTLAIQDNLDEKSKDIDEKVSELKELRSEMADMKTALSTSIKDSNHSKEVVEAEREKMKKALGMKHKAQSWHYQIWFFRWTLYEPLKSLVVHGSLM